MGLLRPRGEVTAGKREEVSSFGVREGFSPKWLISDGVNFSFLRFSITVFTGMVYDFRLHWDSLHLKGLLIINIIIAGMPTIRSL